MSLGQTREPRVRRARTSYSNSDVTASPRSGLPEQMVPDPWDDPAWESHVWQLGPAFPVDAVFTPAGNSRGFRCRAPRKVHPAVSVRAAAARRVARQRQWRGGEG